MDVVQKVSNYNDIVDLLFSRYVTLLDEMWLIIPKTTCYAFHLTECWFWSWGLCTIWVRAVLLTFQKYKLPPSSGLKWVGWASAHEYTGFGPTDPLPFASKVCWTETCIYMNTTSVVKVESGCTSNEQNYHQQRTAVIT